MDILSLVATERPNGEPHEYRSAKESLWTEPTGGCESLRVRRSGRADGPLTGDAQGSVTLGATLLSLRIARGLSQQELSQISGVEQADISRIERANVDPRARPCCGYWRAWPHG